MTITLCLLTWNEIDGCKHDLPLLPLDGFDEVFAVDNGSSDGTVEFLHSNNIRVIHQDRPTYNGAYLVAFLECTSDYIVFYHPKGSIKADECLQFRSFFEQGYDIVIGSRNIEGGRNEEDGKFIKPRKWFVMGIALISATLWKKQGPVIWDVLHGFRGYRKSTYFSINARAQGVTIDLESVVRAYKMGIPVVEFPVCEIPRLRGTTHFKAWPVGRQLLTYIWNEFWRSR